MEKFTVKETSEMVAFVARLVSAGDKALEDGNVSLIDVTLMYDPLRVAGSAVKDAKLIPQELGDLSETELDSLSLIVETELELRNEFAKQITLEVVDIAGKLAILLRKIREHKENQLESDFA